VGYGASGSCAVNVIFSPTGAGSRTGNIKIANSANIVPISIPLTGTGAAAPPTPSPWEMKEKFDLITADFAYVRWLGYSVLLLDPRTNLGLMKGYASRSLR